MTVSSALEGEEGGGSGWKAIRIVVVVPAGSGSREGEEEDRPAFEVGWGVYEMFVTADDA